MSPSIPLGNGMRQSRLVIKIRQNRLVLTPLTVVVAIRSDSSPW
jgi:hypothetical protein